MMWECVCLKWEEWWCCLMDMGCVVLEQKEIPSIYMMYMWITLLSIFIYTIPIGLSSSREERGHQDDMDAVWFLVIIHPGNASKLERSFWNSYFCVQVLSSDKTKITIGERCFLRMNKMKNLTSATFSASQCDPKWRGRAVQCNSNIKIPKCNNNRCSILLRIHHQQNLWNL